MCPDEIYAVGLCKPFSSLRADRWLLLTWPSSLCSSPSSHGGNTPPSQQGKTLVKLEHEFRLTAAGCVEKEQKHAGVYSTFIQGPLSNLQHKDTNAARWSCKAIQKALFSLFRSNKNPLLAGILVTHCLNAVVGNSAEYHLPNATATCTGKYWDSVL